MLEQWKSNCMDIWWFHHGTSGGFTIYHWSNSSCATFFEKIRLKFTLILEVRRSVKSPKKPTQKIPKKPPPPKPAHVCVWSQKHLPFPPVTWWYLGSANGGSFFEELYVYFAFLDVKGDRALLRMVLRWGLRLRNQPGAGWSWLDVYVGWVWCYRDSKW